MIVGCGYVGTRLGVRLASEGHRVYGLRRDAAALPAPIEGIAADVTSPTGIGALPPDLEVVVYCLAAKSRDEARYRAAYIDGLGNTLRALRDEGQRPRRLIFTSSTSVYGQSRDEWVDEASPTHPTGFAGEIQLAAEGIALGSFIPATVLRLGGIYGPGRTGTIDRVRAGEPALGDGYGNRIHRDDAAGALAHLVALEAPESIYLGVDSEPSRARDVSAWLVERLGLDPAILEGEPSAGGAGRRGVGSKRCCNARLLESGYTFTYPNFREGYAALIEEMGL